MTSFEDPKQTSRGSSIQGEEFKQGGKFISKGQQSLEISDPWTESSVTISLSNPLLAVNLHYRAVIELSEYAANEFRIVYAEQNQDHSREMFKGIKTVYTLPDAEGKSSRSAGLLFENIFPLRWLVETFGQQVEISVEQEGTTVRFYQRGDLVNPEDALRTLYDCYLIRQLAEHQEGALSIAQIVETQAKWGGIICENLDDVKRLLSTYFEELGRILSNSLGGKLVSFSRLERGLEEVDIPQDLKINSGNENQARESQYKRLQDMLDGICEEIKSECQEIGYFSTTINSAVRSTGRGKSNDFTIPIEVEALKGKFLVHIQDSSGLDWASELAEKLGQRRALESVSAQIELSEVARRRVEHGEFYEELYIVDFEKAFNPVGLDYEWLVRQVISRSLLLGSEGLSGGSQNEFTFTVDLQYEDLCAEPVLLRRDNKVYVLGRDYGGKLTLELRISPINGSAVTVEEQEKMLALLDAICNSIKTSHS